MNLTVGGASLGYPQPGLNEFLTSAGHPSASHPTQKISSFSNSPARTNISVEATPHSSSFVTLTLPFDVAIDVPRDWWILDDTINKLIQTSRDAVLDLRGIPTSEDNETVLIAANSWPPMTYAALRVTRIQPPYAAPEEIRALTKTELAQLGGAFEAELRQSLPLQGSSFLETLGIEVINVGGWPAIVFSYRRSAPSGPVVDELIQVIRRKDFLRIGLSYRESERPLWMPVVTRIQNSIKAS